VDISDHRNPSLRQASCACQPGNIAPLRGLPADRPHEDAGFVYTANVSERYKQLVEQLHGAVATTTGLAYLEHFVLQFGELFAADHAAIAVLDGPDRARLRTLALSTDGELAAELLWPLPGSPGADVINGPTACSFRTGVQAKFPRDPVLRDTGVDSYLGVPLVATSGEVLGLIILMGRKALADDLLAIEIATLFADRVIAEIERLLHDTTAPPARDQSEKRVRDLEDELLRARKELETFTYAASHDLRGPLRAIGGFAETLALDYRDHLDPVARDYLERIRNNARQMDQLINALQTMSRVTRHALRPSRVDLSRICHRILDRLQQRNPERRISVSVQEDIEAYADPDLLRMALEQLLANAWKFTANVDHASIELSARNQGGETVYCLKDNGAGFSMAYADKLFEMFQRLHAQQAFDGIGAGLATVRRIIDRHGGSVWAEGEVGKGASIYFTLPQAPVAAP